MVVGCCQPAVHCCRWEQGWGIVGQPPACKLHATCCSDLGTQAALSAALPAAALPSIPLAAVSDLMQACMRTVLARHGTRPLHAVHHPCIRLKSFASFHSTSGLRSFVQSWVSFLIHLCHLLIMCTFQQGACVQAATARTSLGMPSGWTGTGRPSRARLGSGI